MPTEKSEQQPRILLLKLNFGASMVTTGDALVEALPHLEQPHTTRCKCPWPLHIPLFPETTVRVLSRAVRSAVEAVGLPSSRLD